MIRVLLLLLIATLQHHAETIDPLFSPLFASVKGIAEKDILNVREKPRYNSKKVASLPEGAYIGIEKCRQIEKSVWCQIYHMAQYDYEDFDFDTKGWVNARYLEPSNRGYVIIDSKGHCDYAMECKENICEVVDSYETNNENVVTSIKTKWIERTRLHGESHFGAMETEEGASGYCTTGRYIEEYLESKKFDRISTKYYENAYLNAESFLKHLVIMDDTYLEAHFDPQLGVMMTEMVSFSQKNKLHFTRNDIKNIQKNRKNKIHWGVTYGKGDDIWLSLYEYMKQLTRPLSELTEVKKLDSDMKGFGTMAGVELVGYEFIWRNIGTEHEEYTWLGLVIIMGKKRGTEKWYVVGLLRDRWTI